MRRAITTVVLALWVFPVTAGAQSGSLPDSTNFDKAAVLVLVNDDSRVSIEINAEIDGFSLRDYWEQTIQSIFEFADVNNNQRIEPGELHLIPSARAVSYSATSGFTPPIDAVTTVGQLVGSDAADCSLAELRQYYRGHSTGDLRIATGPLRSSTRLQDALISGLDVDKDGTIGGQEWMSTDSLLKKLDTNDDELISAGELVPGVPYPGCAATLQLKPHQLTSLELPNKPQITLENRVTDLLQDEEDHHWRISVVDEHVTLMGKAIQIPGCSVEVWTSGDHRAYGPSNVMVDIRASMQRSPTDGEERRQSTEMDWLVRSADRDRNGAVDERELTKWEQLQHQIVHGQLSVSILHGGGLFELLDSNHDHALSIRELRTALLRLHSRGCLSDDDHLQVDRIPNVLLVTFQACNCQLESPASELVPDWFRSMDRNHDGDISAREFSGSLDKFRELDRDHDQLISAAEADSKLDKPSAD